MGQIEYLSFDDILGYYADTIEQSGDGTKGVLSQDGIDKILDFVQNDSYYPTFEDTLTYLVFAFCTGHYFVPSSFSSSSFASCSVIFSILSFVGVVSFFLPRLSSLLLYSNWVSSG